MSRNWMRWSALSFCTVALAACSTSQVITEANPLNGNPRLVSSRASVDTCPYKAAVSREGCVAERTDITGWVVLPKNQLDKIVTERERALAAVEEAITAINRRTQDEAVRRELAKQCANDPVCRAKAKPAVDQILSSKAK